MVNVVSNIGAQVNLQIVEGTDFITTLTFTNPDNSPFNLTGCQLFADIKKTPQSATVLVSFSITIAEDPTTGVAKMTLADADNDLTVGLTLTDPNGQYFWDLKFVDSLGNTSRPLYGTVSVWWGVTP